jgi:hypothetical protein
MTHPRLITVGLTAIAVLAVACGATTTTSEPSPGDSTIPSVTIVPTVVPTSVPTSAPTSAPPSAPTSTPPTPTASLAACEFVPQGGLLPSDRFTDIRVSSTASGDQITFVFDDPSIGNPGGSPRGTLAIAPPPFTFGGSGEEIKMRGQNVLLMRFKHMSLSNDVGQETYGGPREVKPDLPALRHAVLFDEFEGIVGWYVGYDGSGCATLSQNGSSVTLTITHQ